VLIENNAILIEIEDIGGQEKPQNVFKSHKMSLWRGVKLKKSQRNVTH